MGIWGGFNESRKKLWEFFLSFFLSQGFGNEIVMDGIGGVGFGILCCAMEEGRESSLALLALRFVGWDDC